MSSEPAPGPIGSIHTIDPDDPNGRFDLELSLLLDAIYRRYQHDFRRYAISSLRRRVR